MDADPRTDPYLRGQPRGDRPPHARVGARQRGGRRAGVRRAGRPARRRSTSTCCSRPTARSRGPTPSGTSCRSASTSRSARELEGRIGELQPHPARLRAGPRARDLRDRGPQGRDDHLLRVGVRLPGAAARARRRAGDRRVDEQPLLRAFGELGPARRDRPDARGRDRPARSCRPRSRGSRRSSTPTASCTQRTAALRADGARGDRHGDHGRDAVRPVRRVGDLGLRARAARRGRRRARPRPAVEVRRLPAARRRPAVSGREPDRGVRDCRAVRAPATAV